MHNAHSQVTNHRESSSTTKYQADNSHCPTEKPRLPDLQIQQKPRDIWRSQSKLQFLLVLRLHVLRLHVHQLYFTNSGIDTTYVVNNFEISSDDRSPLDNKTSR
jgi:hypothetical protein